MIKNYLEVASIDTEVFNTKYFQIYSMKKKAGLKYLHYNKSTDF